MRIDTQIPTTAVPVDVADCDREPIHIPGSVQPFGFLIALTSDWVVASASENAGRWFGRPASDLLGCTATEIFRAEAIHDIRGRLHVLRDSTVERIFRFALFVDGALFDVAIHRSGELIVIEAEPIRTENGHAGHLVQSLIERLQEAPDLSGFCHLAARHIRVLTGFDRVMLYRFDQVGAGEVVAESARSGLAPYLGLHYPASDIPQQARRLYERNWLRIICDVDAVPAAIISADDSSLKPLDLSMSVLRSVSPIHLEYLRNMDVAASLSVSVMRGGKLWGLFVCHHAEPRQVPFELRTGTELYGQMFSWILEAREREVDILYEANARAVHNELVGALASRAATTADLADFLGTLSAIVRSDGAGLSIAGKISLTGATPSAMQATAIANYLAESGCNQVAAINSIGELLESAREHIDVTAGLLAVPLSRVPGDYLMFFRKEASRPVTWAGQPHKPSILGPDGMQRLTPRTSFAAWRELVRGQCVPWSEADVRIAEALRTTVLEIILRMTDTAEKDRRVAQDHQELLIAELNHRVRNILNLIRALVTQSRAGSDTLEDFASVIGGRIQALARAHDQITATNWGPGSLHDLIRLEAGAYLGAMAERVEIIGDDVLMEPQAFSTVALVFHEMMTNAAKYGAFADSHGTITVKLDRYPNGSLVIEWKETGGPTVTAPTRRGFGTTIIERSIPHEIQGEAEVRYVETGVEATFSVPARFFKVAENERPLTKLTKPDPMVDNLSLSGNFLLVEDNLVIALESEDMLLKIGATSVQTASSVRDALRLISIRTPDFAMLDMNLGTETSLLIAIRLRELAVPFVFATGYGEKLGIPEDLADVAILKKPFDVPALRKTFSLLVTGKIK